MRVERLVICYLLSGHFVTYWDFSPPGPGPWRQYTELEGDTGSTGPSVLCCEWREEAGTWDHLNNNKLFSVLPLTLVMIEEENMDVSVLYSKTF